jgi:hypothetical protein
LVRRVRRVGFEPQCIGTEVDVARPFQAAAPLADAHWRETCRIVEIRKHAFADKVAEAARQSWA